MNYLWCTTVQTDRVIEEVTAFIAAYNGVRDRNTISAAGNEAWASKMASRRLISAQQLKTLPLTTE